MAKKPNLTPQRKAELKKEVLEALEKPDKEMRPAISVVKMTKDFSKQENKIVPKKTPIADKDSGAISKPRAGVKFKASFKRLAKSKAVAIKTEKPAKPASRKTESKSEIKAVSKKPLVPAVDQDLFASDKKKPFFKPLPLQSKPVSLPWDKPSKKEESLESIFDKSTPKKDKKTLTISWWRLISAIVLSLAIILGIDLFGVYKLGFRDAVSLQVAKAFNLPAGAVNGKMISLVDYYDDLNFLSLAISKKSEGINDVSAWSDISDKVFYRQAANLLVQDRLLAYNKAITDDFLKGQIEILISQAGSLKQAESIVKGVYGLNLAQFKEMILRPLTEREILQEAISADESLPINKEAKARAEDVLKQALEPGADFSVLASKYTEDEVGINTGGDLGWAMKGQLDQRWESQLFGLPAGTVFDKVISSKFGYHVVKVEQKLSDPDTGKESIKIRHVLIKVDVDKYIKEMLDGAKVVKYVK